jgi:hypothetical protein
MENCQCLNGIETKALPWQTIMGTPNLKLTMQKFFCCVFALLWHGGDNGIESVLQLQKTHHYAAQGNALPSCILLSSI